MGGKHKGTQFDFADLTRGKKGDQRKDIIMNKEELIKLGISETVANQIMESLNGSFVPKSRFNEINTELATARNTIKERDGQLEALEEVDRRHRRAQGSDNRASGRERQAEEDSRRRNEVAQSR